MGKLLLPFSLILTACSLEASISSLVSKMPFLEKNQLSGFVSSSDQHDTTNNGYKVQSSSGDYSDKIEETTNGGYTVYISVQGNIVSTKQ